MAFTIVETKSGLSVHVTLASFLYGEFSRFHYSVNVPAMAYFTQSDLQQAADEVLGEGVMIVGEEKGVLSQETVREKKGRHRSKHWSSEETEMMLEIWADEKIQSDFKKVYLYYSYCT